MSKSPVFTLILLCIAGMMTFTACETTQPAQEEQEVGIDETQAADQSKRAEKVKKIFYTIPSPVEMASLIKKSGAPFDKDNLNNVDNANNYSTIKSQALNLGVYGADLSYTNMFDQNQESIFYLSAAQKLAKDLGVQDAINDDVYNRINDNMDNRDSLLAIVSDAYWSLNGYLKEGDREDVSALVIAGGWVEGLYLASQHWTPDNNELRQRIAEQKYSLKDLSDLLSSYEGSEYLGSVIEDMKAIQAIFDDVKVNKEKTETSVDDAGTVVIGGKSEVTIDDETLQRVMEKIAEIRTSYIQ